MDDAVFRQGTQASAQVAGALEEELTQFLAPVLEWLDTLLDKRLVRTLVASIVALVEWRNRAHGLLLSELGAYICDPAHAPAGTKRLSNLLRSPKWEANGLHLYFWRQATQRLTTLETAGETPLLIWDTSVLEKPESIASPDLGAVRSSKAQRLTHIKPGFYHPPSRPLFVPGWRWIGLLLVGLSGASGPPCVADMRVAPLVDDARPTCQRPQSRPARPPASLRPDLAPPRPAHLGSRLCRARLVESRAGVSAALRRPPVVRWPKRYQLLSDRSGVDPVPAWRIALAYCARAARLGVPLALGCAPPRRAAYGRASASRLAARRLLTAPALVAARRTARPRPGTLVPADH